MKSEIQKNLEKLAFKRTKPFCYQCYKVAPTGRCTHCMSDDLMRELEGVGVEYGLCRTRHNPYYAESKIMLNPPNLLYLIEEIQFRSIKFSQRHTDIQICLL